MAASVLAGCAPAARPGSLPATLTMADVGGAPVAVQNGIPVPTFEAQARRRVDLSGPWRVERAQLDSNLSLTDRDRSLEAIVAEAGGREAPAYDDGGWGLEEVPGALNLPPDDGEVSGWYRRSFYVPRTWEGASATLKVGAINYIGDVWVNGAWVGYHEGGYTPFAFDVSATLLPGRRNTIAVRVDNPPWGTRNDIVPWGLADWWNYGGITQPLWIEATRPLHAVRADVVPHLDGADVSVVVRRAEALVAVPGASPTPTPTPTPSPSPTQTQAGEPSGQPSSTGGAASASPSSSPPPEGARVEVDVFGAEVGIANVSTPFAGALVPDGADPLVSATLTVASLEAGEVEQVETGFLLGGADHWTPARPALYVLRVRTFDAAGDSDELWTSFGLRDVSVSADTPQLLLNGEPIMLTGVGLHDEIIEPGEAALTEEAPAHRVHRAEELLAQLDHVRRADAQLIRAGHTPANPLLLMLADRLGFAVWEEIPLYHYTPLTYGIAMDRGIPQQMLREMALRDMNRPSVLFHGLSNESTGEGQREAALRTLVEIDRDIDGTRLTGQAAYGSMPDDPTQDPLDVAGYTFYYGVFYGADATVDTARALRIAHETNPDKPILALEFGRWADGAQGPARQESILADTFPVLERRSAANTDGYVGAAVWWSLEDFTTMTPGIGVEHFGLFTPDGEPRPAAATAAELFSATAGLGDIQQIESDVRSAEVAGAPAGADLRLFAYLGYGLAFSLGVLALLLTLLTHRGGRATGAGLRSGR
jgi:beta-glucuronidase